RLRGSAPASQWRAGDAGALRERHRRVQGISRPSALAQRRQTGPDLRPAQRRPPQLAPAIPRERSVVAQELKVLGAFILLSLAPPTDQRREFLKLDGRGFGVVLPPSGSGSS